MKKQKGFTLIELMVVMAIIAILATAGLSAYTGYIKKARDATRIADISAINKIVLGTMSSVGLPPPNSLEVYNAVLVANNWTPLVDPFATVTSGWVSTTTKSLCMSSAGVQDKLCYYTYRICDAGLGYAVWTRFESKSNLGLYLSDDIVNSGANHADDALYEIGSCNIACQWPANDPIGCPISVGHPTKLSCANLSLGSCTLWGDSLDDTL